MRSEKGVKNTGVKNTGVKNTGVKNAEVKNTGVKNAEVKNAEVKNAEVKNAEVKPNALPIIGGRASRSTTQSKSAIIFSKKIRQKFTALVFYPYLCIR